MNGCKDPMNKQETDNNSQTGTEVILDQEKLPESNYLQRFKAYQSIIPPPPPDMIETNEDASTSPLCSCFKQLSIGQEWLIWHQLIYLVSF